LFPGAQIDLVCRTGVSQFFIDQKMVSRAFEVKKGDRKSYLALVKQLRIENYDICISPHQSLRTAIFISSLGAKTKVGFKNWWNKWFFTHRISRDKTLPDALRQLSLMDPFDGSLKNKMRDFANNVEILPDIPKEFSMKLDIQSVSLPELLTGIMKTKYALIAPGSQWPTKRWSVDGFVEVIRKLMSEKYEVVLVGSGTEDVLINKRLSDLIPGLIDLTNSTSLSELAYLMTKATVLVCNDSGLMHLAATAGLPVVAIFGPTTPALGYRPWQNRAQIIEKTLFCRPCGRHGHKICPLRTHECMKLIKSSDVMAGITKVYTGPDQRGQN